MTLTLIATPSAVDANCYCTLAEAEAYVATLVWSEDWTGKTDEQKKASIINGARLLDTLSWKGSRSAQTQSMAWPRCEYSSAPRFEGMTISATGYLVDRDGYQIPSDTVPVCVKNSNAEFALRLFGEDRSSDSGGITPDKLKIGQLELTSLRRRMIPASVIDLIGSLLASTGGTLSAVRG